MFFTNITADEMMLKGRDLSEKEKEAIESAKAKKMNPLLLCPDHGVILDSEEEVEVCHAFKATDGIWFGVNYSDGKYGTVHVSKIKLINPKYDWAYIAHNMESSRS